MPKKPKPLRKGFLHEPTCTAGAKSRQPAMVNHSLCAKQQRTHDQALRDMARDDQRPRHRTRRSAPYPVTGVDAQPGPVSFTASVVTYMSSLTSASILKLPVPFGAPGARRAA